MWYIYYEQSEITKYIITEFIILSVPSGVWIRTGILTLVPISHVVVVIVFLFRNVLFVVDDSTLVGPNVSTLLVPVPCSLLVAILVSLNKIQKFLQSCSHIGSKFFTFELEPYVDLSRRESLSQSVTTSSLLG